LEGIIDALRDLGSFDGGGLLLFVMMTIIITIIINKTAVPKIIYNSNIFY
jgi:hypothetical protein